MKSSIRQSLIIDAARADGRVEVAALAERFDVTAETIRRDLTSLERKGLVHRVYGGAIPLARLGYEPSLADRTHAQQDEKERIARAALSELPDGGSVSFDAGTSVSRMVDLLPDDVALTVITHAPALIPALAARSGITLHLAGGEIRSLTLAAVGSWAERAYAETAIDVAFVGTNAVSVGRGLCAPDLREAAVKRAMVRHAERVILLADHTKLGRTDFGVICPLEDIDLLITDSAAEPELVDEIRSAGVDVLVV
ncbi:DeoR/GlpR family DNA-binding transcription regulator [Microbacterium telephonicum]|uniref:Lactose phosphotransferase system repressor n=1 Tax=Microbacterium telephonicum TaxID=1714841 RepID=A0A498BYG9_9MICO|nr:DeoR/GlpR family DNA-binding transcription regulator [Microbacterium telephonicum]RLK47889.1 DeoR family transcriptional regulator [Microbacterium telephonicum]